MYYHSKLKYQVFMNFYFIKKQFLSYFQKLLCIMASCISFYKVFGGKNYG
ncbi:hypothetical protein HFN_0477 [Helicobacter fennelliae MRY12-0050]|uniref:Uncharacterized protein n=1 Tax=Helicobacter fennelliae MRY12-0050 TaxID=1325130 RepID=T1D2A3_9HELI|nr:hypothetical protein HFN_0477 [Helicobacter fennelliae MRY12-0050]